MNVNPLREKWRAGEAAVGVCLMYSRDIATVEIAAGAGLDFILFDLEHRPQSSETIHDLSQVARLTGMASLVGPADINHHAISHALDLGASGVVIPHVETAADVTVAIEAVRYSPKGKRGRCGTAGHNLYRGRPTAEEIEHYNRDVALLLKIESEVAIENIEALLAPEDVDGVMVGPADLSLDMGIPGETSHQRVVAAIERVRTVCRDRDIQYGVFLASPDAIPDAVSQGAT